MLGTRTQGGDGFRWVAPGGTRYARSTFLLVVVLLALGPGAQAGDLPRPITLFHTNDWHGTVEPTPALWLRSENPPLVGGPALLSGLLRQLKIEVLRGGGRYLLVDSGDRFQGAPVVNLSRGRLMTELYNVLHYDIVALGNHDFDYDLAGLREAQQGSRFPLVCTNLRLATAGAVLWRPSLAVRCGETMVGFVAAMTEDLPRITFARNIAGVRVERVAPALRQEVARLRSRGCGLIVLLSHCGHLVDLALALAVPGIDIILGGHTQDNLEEPLRLGSTWIAQTRGFGSHLGAMTIWPGEGGRGIRKLEYRNHLLDAATVPADPAIEAMLASASASLREVLARPVGRLERPLRRAESGAGSFGEVLCRAVATRTGVPIAMYHLGGLRGDLPAGPVTFGQVSAVLPFDHRVLIGHLTGKDLQALVSRGGGLRIIAWTGLECGPGGQVTRIDGTPLEPDALYKVAYNDYLGQGGDGFLEFTRAVDLTDPGILVREAFLASLASGAPRSPASGSLRP